ncbi:hypothetical protein I3J13_09105 [Agrobacterium sp. MOPV5]|uniref:hypothetical protein n=1 Tax=Agrobacterium leguminum TaxID=2792015 RepID=UPI0018C2DF70|nr:hypothetical protein [Agrobacterium leguminum]MBG0508921.1 hypothetical protein [Agrobacterium leguminum]
MRMKINQKIAGGASASERFYEIALESDFLSDDASKIVTSTEILQNSIEAMFRDSDALRFLKDDRFAGYHLISADERRYVTYQVDDTFERSRALEKLASDLSSALFDLRNQMRKAGMLSAAPEPSGLDAAIDAWRAAFDAWKATDKGDGSDLACDTPEALCEQRALLALSIHPCATMDEVRRKADLFQSDQYLNGMAEDFTFDLLRSFAEAGGA